MGKLKNNWREFATNYWIISVQIQWKCVKSFPKVIQRSCTGLYIYSALVPHCSYRLPHYCDFSGTTFIINNFFFTLTEAIALFLGQADGQKVQFDRRCTCCTCCTCCTLNLHISSMSSLGRQPKSLGLCEQLLWDLTTVKITTEVSDSISNCTKWQAPALTLSIISTYRTVECVNFK